jgi:energy-coupling factor transporter ATP-binding protein EcfA2
VPVSELLAWFAALGSSPDPTLNLVLTEISSRLTYLTDVGLGYLTLDRATRTLSGGEVERVNLTTCLGASLTGTLFVLDEPTVGLHPRDIHRLVGILHGLRDKGNTLVVVEHESTVICAADHLIDLSGARSCGFQPQFFQSQFFQSQFFQSQFFQSQFFQSQFFQPQFFRPQSRQSQGKIQKPTRPSAARRHPAVAHR